MKTQLLRHTAIVARQLCADLPLRTGDYATLDEVKTIVAGLDKETTLLVATAIIANVPNSTHRNSVLNIFDAHMGEGR